MNFQDFLGRTGLDCKPFQTECFDWCIKKEHDAPVKPATKRGGILALEMGLGKTIIMLSLINCNLKHHTLIVLPRSLLDQWEKNIFKHLGHKPLVYHGSRPKSLKMSLAEIQTRPIILTTYGQVSYPSKKQELRGRKLSLLHNIHWNRVICDEAHHVSHKKTNEYKGIEALIMDICWLVTGTPVQNNNCELYDMYGLLGLPASAEWRYYFNGMYVETAQHFIFHKTKAGVGLQIPALHEHIQKVAWANEAERQFAAHIHSLVNFCNIKMEGAAEYIYETSDQKAMRMKYMTKAKQVCSSSQLIPSDITHFKLLAKQTKMDLLGDAGQQLYLSSSKLDAVMKTLMERKANGCGKIVFFHYYGEIDEVEKRITQQDPTLRIAKFDGRVPNGKRESILSTPVDILLAQIKMCREGLNLQEHYSEVYLITPHFNPATEHQAIARCWRMGQTKPVHVFRYEMESPASEGADDTEGDEAAASASDTEGASAAADTEGASAAADTEASAAAAGDEAKPKPVSLDAHTFKLHEVKRKCVAAMEEAAGTPIVTDQDQDRTP